MVPGLVSALVLTQTAVSAPKLTIVISIDQFRSDYLTRYSNLYLPVKSGSQVGGFNWLMKEGANFVNSAYAHVPTYTGPGHAVIGTGSSPSLNGIVDNSWLDRATGKEWYVVSDPESKDVFSGKASYSPRTLFTTTFGDELKLATNGKAKCVSLALKDRASILMIGHLADACLWFDKDAGRWTTSDFYAPSMKLPQWATEINAEKIPDKKSGQSWNLSLPNSALSQAIVANPNGASAAFGKQFPHTVGNASAGRTYYDLWTLTPWANDWVLESASRAIAAEGLGKDPIPDVLTINLSTNDYVGHAFGPYSPEAMEMSVATDASLSRFFNRLQAQVSLKNVMIILTADHGVMPNAEDLVARKLPGGRVKPAEIADPIRAALTQKYGDAAMLYPAGIGEFNVYLDHSICASRGIDLGEAQEVIRAALMKVPQVQAAYTGMELQRGLPGSDRLSQALNISFDRVRNGDVIYYLRPGFLYGGTAGTSHGSPWDYDTRVPLLIWGLPKGQYGVKCGPQDIAATVCHALGIGNTSGNVGRALP